MIAAQQVQCWHVLLDASWVPALHYIGTRSIIEGEGAVLCDMITTYCRSQSNCWMLAGGISALVLWAFFCCRYSWRHQMADVHATGQWDVVAVDMRGYNTSDKPKVRSRTCNYF
jgi:hypothetical protein